MRISDWSSDVCSSDLRVKDLIARSEEPVLGLRVGISTKGCSGMSYVVEYAKEQRKLEDVVEGKGVKIFIEPTAVMFLLGSQMDYVEDKFQSGDRKSVV